MAKTKWKKIEKGIRRKNTRNGNRYGIYGSINGQAIPEKEFVTLKGAREFRLKYISARILSTGKEETNIEKLAKEAGTSLVPPFLRIP